MDLSVYDPCVDGADDERKSRRGGITLWIERGEFARCRIISSRWPVGVNVSVPVLLWVLLQWGQVYCLGEGVLW